jgi:hypothetical protein
MACTDVNCEAVLVTWYWLQYWSWNICVTDKNSKYCLLEQLADCSATSTQLYTLPLWQHDGTWQMLSHPSFSILHRHQNWCSQEGQKLCQDVGSVRLVWNSKQDIFKIFYKFHQQLAVDGVIVVFKGRVVLEQSIQKKSEHVGIKIYKLCSSIAYVRHWSLHGEGVTAHSLHLTAAHAIVTALT